MQSNPTNTRSRYEIIKKRVLTVKSDEIINLIGQAKFINTKLMSEGNIITRSNVNEILMCFLAIPELLADNVMARKAIKKRIDGIIDCDDYQDFIDDDVYMAIENLFEWIKLRSDYTEL